MDIEVQIIDIYHSHVNYEWNEVSDNLKDSIKKAIRKALESKQKEIDELKEINQELRDQRQHWLRKYDSEVLKTKELKEDIKQGEGAIDSLWKEYDKLKEGLKEIIKLATTVDVVRSDISEKANQLLTKEQ